MPPTYAVENEACDSQLHAGLLDPIVAPTAIRAIPDLRDHAFEPDVTGMREHFGAVDLEAFAELDVGIGDDFFKLRFALSSFYSTEKSVSTIRCRHDDLTVDNRRPCFDVPSVVSDLLEAVRPVVAASGKIVTGSLAWWTWTR